MRAVILNGVVLLLPALVLVAVFFAGLRIALRRARQKEAEQRDQDPPPPPQSGWEAPFTGDLDWPKGPWPPNYTGRLFRFRLLPEGGLAWTG